MTCFDLIPGRMRSHYVHFTRYQYRTGKQSGCLGGHNVPESKIRERYDRCMKQIKTALPFLHRAYFFDNISEAPLFFAEYEQDSDFIFHEELLPGWFRHYVLGRNLISTLPAARFPPS